MTAFLTDEWFAAVQAHAAALPEVPGASLTMQHVVSGSPAGKVQCVVDVRDGRVVEVRAGKRADAGCTITWTYDDARALLQGEDDLDVAFMQGRLKVDGDYVGLMFRMRTVFGSPAGAAFAAAVRASTDA
jgi:predicted lipid carrier protein YhbT